MKRLLAVVLTMVLAISGFSIPASAKSDRLGDFEHSKSKFSEYEYEHYDTTDLEGKINDIETLCVDSANIKTLEKMVVEIEDELYLLNDLVNYSNYQFTRNDKDEYWKGEDLYCSEIYTAMATLYLEKLKVLIESPCKESLYVIYTEEDLKYLLESEIPDPKVSECRQKHEQLLAEYYAINPEIEYSGKVYTMESFLEEYYAGELSDFAVAIIYRKLLDQMVDDIGDIYFRMIENNKKIAELCGYDEYLDYAFENVFYRHYSPKDSIAICDIVREKLQPLKDLFKAYNNTYVQNMAKENLSEGIIKVFGKYIGEIAPEFKESYDYMVETESFLVIPSNESQTSFTSYLRLLGMPFTCMTESEDKLWEMETLTHEFGHYNSLYWRNLKHSGMNALDLEETYSQGMEYLFAKFYPEVYGDAAKGAEMKLLGATLDEMYTGSMIAETEYLAYTGEYADSNELIAALDELHYKYYPNTNPIWYQIPHIFQYPGYYISYVTSAVSALEIYEKSKEDYEKAVEDYVELIKNSDEDYLTALEKSGLTSKWTEEEMNDFLDELIDIYVDTEAPVIYGVEEGGVYTGSANVKVVDTAGLNIALVKNGMPDYKTVRTFVVAGSEDPYTLSVMDAFGNVTQVNFTVEPAPFTVAAEAQNKKNILTWSAVEGATYYKVYGAVLGKGYKLLGTTDEVTLSFSDKVKGKKSYKYYVTACTDDMAGDEVVLAKSYKCYVVGAKNTKKTDTASLEIEGDETIEMTNGNITRISAIRNLEDADRLDIATGKKIKGVRFISTNKDVAKVSSKGKITAVGEGNCFIYAVSENGKIDRIIVKVSA